MKNTQTSEDLLEQAIRAHRRVLEPSVERLEVFRQAVNSLHVPPPAAVAASTPLGVYAKHLAMATLVAGLGYGWYASAQRNNLPQTVQTPQSTTPRDAAALRPSVSPDPSASENGPGERQQEASEVRNRAAGPAPQGGRTSASNGGRTAARRSTSASTEDHFSDVSPAQRLVQADWALRSGEPAKARELLAHWTPTARHEKTAAALQVLIGCGLKEDVSAKRRQFSKRWPHSAFDQRIAQECPVLRANKKKGIPKNQL